jgi:hypothetical protein
MLIENLAMDSDSNVAFVGRDELQGHPMFVFQHSLGGLHDLASSRTKTWVGVKDGFPYRIETEARVTPERNEFAVKTTTSFYDYNAHITIEPPM